MLAIVEPAALPSALAALARSGIESLVVGEVVETADLGGQRYTEGSLSSLTQRR
jgi:hypothetical protein